MARSICIYGPTGVYKTTQVKWFAHYIAKKTGKATLLLSTDGGGWAPCQPEIDAGMIRAFRCDTSALPLPMLRLISKGYWPRNPDATDPNKLDFQPIDSDEIGGFALEGWTSISNVIMRWLPDNGVNVGGENRRKLGGFSQDVVAGGVAMNLNFLSNTQGDYGYTQKELYGIVTNLGSLPVDTILHTALEAKSEDDDRLPTYGPAIAGKKATAQCGPWIGDLLHAQDFSVPRTVQVPDPKQPGKKMDSYVVDTVVRYYFKRHLDPQTSIPYPAKTRIPPEKYGALEKLLPDGYFEPTLGYGIDRYLATVDTLTSESSDSAALKEWRDRMDRKLGRNPKPNGPEAAGASAT